MVAQGNHGQAGMAYREALLVAHGSPADPAPQEAAMQALAVRVSFWAPGWRVRGATLAKEGALEAALATLNAPLIYPFFMAEGWFTRINLPRRLKAAGRSHLRQLPPFGADPALPDLLATALAEAGPPGPVLLAAHGSKVSKTSGDTTYQIAATLEARGFGPVHPAFVEQAPFLQEVAQKMVSGTCLPFFALRAGHVAQDVPDALQAAGFSGPLLPPIGEATGTAALIAAALIAALARRD